MSHVLPQSGSYVEDIEDDRKSSPYDKDFKSAGVDAEVSVTEVDVAFASLVAAEEGNDIKHRTMGWKKTALLLFGDQVCLAIMAQAWSFKVLGWIPGLITTFLAGIFFVVTSLTLHKFIMRHPNIQNVCDVGYLIFGGSRIAYEVTGLMLLANNILLIGFHVLTGAKILNTLSDHGTCTVVFSVATALAGIVMSLPRTLNHLTIMSVVSAICMGVAIILFLIFVGMEDSPGYGYGGTYPAAGLVATSAFPLPGTTWIDCTNAVLNIVFLWVPQILFPTFISEMKRPQDFPKALAALSVASFILFIVPTIIGYHYLGQYATAPAFGSLLDRVHIKASFAFVMVPTLVIGVIYSNVSSKYVYQRIMGNSRHAHSNTVIGWSVWVAVVSAIWSIAFIFGNVIPSMGDFLSLLGAAFDSQFGFCMWAIAFAMLYRKEGYFTSIGRSALSIFHIITFAVGLFLLGPGLYAAVEAIIADYAGGTRDPFSCNNLTL